MQQRSRDEWRFRWLEEFRDDVRFAIRQMRRSPTFTAVAAVTLLIVILAYAGIAVDRHLADRAVQEAKRLRAHVIELEDASVREQRVRALGDVVQGPPNEHVTLGFGMISQTNGAATACYDVANFQVCP